MSTPSLTVPAVLYFKIVPPSTIKGRLINSTLVFTAKVCVCVIKKALSVILIVGVLAPDLLVTLIDLIIKVSFTAGESKATSESTVVVLLP